MLVLLLASLGIEHRVVKEVVRVFCGLCCRLLLVGLIDVALKAKISVLVKIVHD